MPRKKTLMKYKAIVLDSINFKSNLRKTILLGTWRYEIGN